MKDFNYIKTSVKTVLKDRLYAVLALSIAVNLLLLYYQLFLQTTTFEVFFLSNSMFYNWLSIGLTILNGLFFGLAVAMAIYVWKKKKSKAATSAVGSNTFGAVFGAISTGCPVCGAYLLPMLGIAGSLAAFPLQGLEIKALSVGLLAWSVKGSAQSIAGICPAVKERLFSQDKQYFILNFTKETAGQAKTALVFVGLLLLVYILPKLPAKYKFSFSASNGVSQSSSQANLNVDSSSLFAEVNPAEGYTINASFGDLGPKLLAAGAIDLEKFKKVYERSGKPLTDEQLKILTEGSSNEKITIDSDNSYFLINFLWALGLANKNPILDEGEMTKYGEGQIGSFASTGGWTLGTKKATELYSKSSLISLTPQQQAIVQEAASGTYRPCCGNSTAFPDCNHGMAMLGLYELMASQGATVDDLFEAGKYFNSFWFPQQYLDLATYFKAKEGKNFSQIDPKVIVGKDYSSAGGWSKTKKWLASNNLVEKAPGTGGGCGV